MFLLSYLRLKNRVGIPGLCGLEGNCVFRSIFLAMSCREKIFALLRSIHGCNLSQFVQVSSLEFGACWGVRNLGTCARWGELLSPTKTSSGQSRAHHQPPSQEIDTNGGGRETISRSPMQPRLHDTALCRFPVLCAVAGIAVTTTKHRP
jgi:hypothetical protein